MADLRVTGKNEVTTIDGTEFCGVFIAAGDKKITFDNLLVWLKAEIDADPDNLVLLTATQTLTNKLLTSPKINENVALTALATDLNLLAGAAAAGLTAAELLYCKTLTSDVQSQINFLVQRYGEIYITGGSTAQTVSKLAWTALAFSAAGANGEASTGITCDKDYSKITIETDGTYRLSANITFTSSIDALTHQFAISRNGSPINSSIVSVYAATGAQTRTITLQTLYKEGGSPIDYQLRYYHNHSTNNDITISNASFIVERVG